MGPSSEHEKHHCQEDDCPCFLAGEEAVLSQLDGIIETARRALDTLAIEVDKVKRGRPRD